MPREIVGKKFAMLKVLEYLPGSRAKRSRVMCECECGVVRSYQTVHVTSGHTKSCGCAKGAMCVAAKLTHGFASGGFTRSTYNIWSTMKARCNNPNSQKYADYGARGIAVCERWMKFENFLEDMGERPDDMSIDRINNDGDYCPENCRWVTAKMQSQNKRKYGEAKAARLAKVAQIEKLAGKKVSYLAPYKPDLAKVGAK